MGLGYMLRLIGFLLAAFVLTAIAAYGVALADSPTLPLMAAGLGGVLFLNQTRGPVRRRVS